MVTNRTAPGSGFARNSQEAAQIAASLVQDLVNELGITRTQAVGIVGNLAHETGNFQHYQEISPTVAGSRGGAGWAQWTGPRRNDFEDYSQQNGLPLNSYQANLGFLIHELMTTEKAALSSLMSANTIEDATKVFERTFERAGVKNYSSRLDFANQIASLAPAQPAVPLEPGVQSTGLLGIPTSAPWGVTPLNDTAYQQMLSNPNRSMQLDPGSYIEGMGGYQARGIGNNGIPEQNPMGYSTAAPAGFVQRGNLLDISPTPSPHPDIVTPIQDWTPGGMARYSNSPGTGTPAPSGTVTQGVDLASPQQSALPNFERGGLFDIAPTSYQSTPGGEQRYANGNTSPSSNLAISDPVKAAYQQMAQSAGGIQNLSGGSSIPMDYITPSNPSPIPQASPVFSNPTTGTDMASGYGQLASSMAGSGLSNLSGAGLSNVPTPTPSPGYMGGSTANIDAVTSPTGVAPTYSGLTPAQQMEYDRSARNGPPGYTPNIFAKDYGQNSAAEKKSGGLFGGTTSMGGIIGGLLGTAALGPIGGYLGAKLGDQIGQRITTPSMPNMGDGGGSAASQRTTRSYTTPSGRTGTVTTGPDGYRSITNEYGATTTRSPAAAAILGWD